MKDEVQIKWTTFGRRHRGICRRGTDLLQNMAYTYNLVGVTGGDQASGTKSNA